MTPNLTMLLVIGALYAVGVYLLLDRSLTRVLLGVLVLGNATNLLLLSSGGPAGEAPLVHTTPDEQMSDALVQALTLTAIVITMGLAAFGLSMVHRTWELGGHDDVDDPIAEEQGEESP